MASTAIILDQRSVKKDGTLPLKIRVIHKGSFYIPLKIDLMPDQWQNGIVINHPLHKRHNPYIVSRKLEIDRIIIDLEDSRKLDNMSCLQLKQYIQKGAQPSGETLVCEYFNTYLKRVHNNGTRSTFQTMFAKLSKFESINTLTFEQITFTWLTNFDEYMISTGMSINGRSIYLRALRRLFNAAIDDEMIINYPFRRFKIKQQETAKRSLTVDELRTLKDYPCEPHQEKYRDIFMLMVYLIGINSVDLFSLGEVRNGRIEYRRSKTGHLFSIKVEPEAQAIIDKYRGKNYLLDVLDTYGNYKDFTHRMNENLRKIGTVERKGHGGKKHRNPLFPKLSTYWARHTWATLAAELDIPDETISLALGHSSGNRVTNIYINRNQKKVDDANRKVIDYLFSIKINK